MKQSHGKTALILVVAAITGWIQSGCTKNLKPAPQANQVVGMESAAEATVADVHMLAAAGDWPGHWRIEQEVTPLRVVIENNGKIPVCLRYSDFTLVGAEGNRFAALPLSAVEGTSIEMVRTPRFRHRNFYVAPYYSDIYPGMTPYPHRFPHDPYYYDRYYTYWSSIELPTPLMREQVLPEGVIDPQGQVEGWLYFEHLNGVSRVTFRADLVSAETGKEFGEIRIPFVLE